MAHENKILVIYKLLRIVPKENDIKWKEVQL